MKINYDKILDEIYDSSNQQNQLSELDKDYRLITLSGISDRLDHMEQASEKASMKTFVVALLTLIVSIIALCVTLVPLFC